MLDGENARQIMTVQADDVTIRGLEFRRVGTSHVEDRAAIKVQDSANCVIEDNRIEDAFFGIYLARVDRCRIARNRLHAQKGRESASGNGIHLWTSNHITIEANEITGHRDGIYLEFVHESDVRDNVSEKNLRYGMHFMYSDDCRYVGNTFRQNGAGVAVMYTKRVAITNNRFEDNWGSASYGLLLKEILEPELTGNRFARNTTGLLIDGVTRLRAERNEFTENGWAVKLLASAQDGRFTGNEFLRNSFDVATNSRETTTSFAGNYWDDYEGYDLDRDGTGDVPHRPVRLFSLLVAQNEPMLITLRSPFVTCSTWRSARSRPSRRRRSWTLSVHAEAPMIRIQRRSRKRFGGRARSCAAIDLGSSRGRVTAHRRAQRRRKDHADESRSSA